MAPANTLQPITGSTGRVKISDRAAGIAATLIQVLPVYTLSNFRRPTVAELGRRGHPATHRGLRRHLHVSAGLTGSEPANST